MAQQLTQALARYQHTKKVGNLLFVAGQGCRDPSSNLYVGLTRDGTGKITSYDIVVQAAAVLANIERALATHQLSRRDLVDINVFLTDINDFDKMNQVWNNFFSECEPPTRTTVAVTKLPGDNFIEMKAVACFSELTTKK